MVSVLDNLLQILKAYESINTNHIILRFTNDDRDIEELIEEVGCTLFPTSSTYKLGGINNERITR